VFGGGALCSTHSSILPCIKPEVHSRGARADKVARGNVARAASLCREVELRSHTRHHTELPETFAARSRETAILVDASQRSAQSR